MSIGSVCMLIGLVSSSAMSYTNRLFTESEALAWNMVTVSDKLIAVYIRGGDP